VTPTLAVITLGRFERIYVCKFFDPMREDYYEDEEDDLACFEDIYCDNVTDHEKEGDLSDEGMKSEPKRKRKKEN
jgi:hypothetical protein